MPAVPSTPPSPAAAPPSTASSKNTTPPPPCPFPGIIVSCRKSHRHVIPGPKFRFPRSPLLTISPSTNCLIFIFLPLLHPLFMHATTTLTARSLHYLELEEQYSAHNYHPLPVVLDRSEEHT